MIYVGIDWADDHHDIAITDDSAKTLAQFQIPHTSDGFAMLHARIANHEKSPGSILVAVETNRGLLVHELLRSGYTVYSINPKAVNRFKDRYTFSKAKSDALDAEALAHLLRTDRHRFKILKPLQEDYRLLDRLCSGLRKLVDEKSRIVNQITSCLKEYYPKPLELFSVDSQIAIAFLKAFPDHDALSACTKKTFSSFFKRHRYTHPDRVKELWRIARSSSLQPDAVAVKAGHLHLAMLLDQLATLQEHLSRYEKEVQAMLDKLPESEPISSLPGVGARLAPELIAALGPSSKDSPHRFHSPDEITKLSGCVPVTRQSGKWKTVSVRYACIKTMRRTFYDWAFTSLKESPWARAYYDYYKTRNQGHSTILRNLGKKWAKILFAVWSQGVTYNETLHVQKLKERNVPWAIAL